MLKYVALNQHHLQGDVAQLLYEMRAFENAYKCKLILHVQKRLKYKKFNHY